MESLIKWLLEGDVSIQYQVGRDLFQSDEIRLQQRILTEGWGKQYMDLQNEDGSWGRGFYMPKWTSTHYTVLDLKNLAVPRNSKRILTSINAILEGHKAADGGIGTSVSRAQSDVCVNGMVLNYACYFRVDENDVKSIIDFLIRHRMHDGGFNCESNRTAGVKHSSLHTTLSVLEGFHEYKTNGCGYRLDEIVEIEKDAIEFILMHQLFLSDRTSAIIDQKFLRFTYPFRWKYTILRAMDYFRSIGYPYDARMEKAMTEIYHKRNRLGSWNLQSKFTGAEHFEMEKAGQPSRWITMTALRILRHYEIDYQLMRELPAAAAEA
ncbi:MAG: hypothetical protein WC824_09250 [Bacteroidota bacterium]|jgi:hypothetical protein